MINVCKYLYLLKFCIFVQEYELYTRILLEIPDFANSSESSRLTSQN